MVKFDVVKVESKWYPTIDGEAVGNGCKTKREAELITNHNFLVWVRLYLRGLA